MGPIRYLIPGVAFSCVLVLAGWRHFHSSNAPTPTPGAAPAAASAATAGQPLAPAAREHFLGAAFRDGRLPPAAAMPDGAPDDRAARLARAVAAGDEHAIPALVSGLLAAGYAIRREDGSLTKTSGAQGMALPEWEVAAFAKLFGRRHTVQLDALAKGLQQAFPALRDVSVADDLLAGIRTSAASDNPATRFWARFVVELGQASYAATNLLDESLEPRVVRLDAIQTALMLTRLAGDLGMIDRRHSPSAAAPAGGDVLQSFGLRPVTLHAAALDGDGACAVETNAGIILDYSATGLTTAFGQLADHLDANYGKIKSWKQGAGFLNILLSLTKFLATYASITADITMDGAALIRTQTLSPGERHLLSAHLHVEPGKYASVTNCLRTALNLAGIDFSLPGQGDLAGVKAIWSLVEDEDTGGLEALLHNAGLDEDESGGNTRDSDPVGGVYLEGRPPAAQLTGKKGETTITVVGAPQDQDLSKQHPLRVERKVRVAVFIQAKPTEMPADSSGAAQMAFGTFGDFLGPLVAAVSGDRWGALTGLATESLYRIAWFASDSHPFTVRDWKPCGDEWSGTVQSVMTGHTERTDRIYDLGTKLTVNDLRRVVNATLVNSKGSETVEYSDNGVETVTGQQFCATNARPPYAPYSSRDTSSVTGKGAGDVTMRVSIEKTAGTYSIEVTPAFEYDVTTVYRPTLSSACPGYDRGALAVTSHARSNAGIWITNQRLDPNSPADVLKGTATVAPEGIGMSTTFTWDLKRCAGF